MGKPLGGFKKPPNLGCSCKNRKRSLGFCRGINFHDETNYLWCQIQKNFELGTKSWWFHFLSFGWYKRRQPCTSNEALALSDFIKQDSKVTVEVEHCPKSLHPILFVFGGSHAMAFSTPHRAQSSTRVKRVCLKLWTQHPVVYHHVTLSNVSKLPLFHHFSILWYFHVLSILSLRCFLMFSRQTRGWTIKNGPNLPQQMAVGHGASSIAVGWTSLSPPSSRVVHQHDTKVAAFSGVQRHGGGKKAKRVTVESDRAIADGSKLRDHRSRWKSLNIIDEPW